MNDSISARIIIIISTFFLILFLCLDWRVGEHGRLTITAVERNLFGSYTLYARNSESTSGNELQEVTYCIDADDTEIANIARESIGKQNVKLVYPEKRIGFYWFDKCETAPIKNIIISE